jgi:hypothetical protein
VKSIAIIDTSVLCELLEIPGKCQNSSELKKSLKRKVRDGEWLFLPLATILETGNHIGQIVDGRLRRERADALRELMCQAIANQSPFTPLVFWTTEQLNSWMAEFPNWAGQGSGLADLTIKKDWEEQCEKNPGRKVYIWSTDAHLSGYDRPAAI